MVRHVMGGVGHVLALDPETVSDVKLALSEACANAIVHGYATAEAEGLMDIAVDVDAHRLHVTVRDHGSGMAPRTDSPGLGVGLPLIASLSESLELTDSTDGGTEVRMTFVRAARDA